MRTFDKINASALVVFSGGQDSTTCLFWAKEVFDSVEAVTFKYNQRHIAEVEVAAAIAEELKVNCHLLDLSLINELSPSSLTRSFMKVESVEEVENLKPGELPNTFVPGRNLLFLSVAGILARQRGHKHIVTGVCETDFSGYPDCRDSFVKALNVAVNLALDDNIAIHTPLMWMNKGQVWKLGDDLGKLEYIKNRTLTCYNGIIGDGCGDCPSCNLRRKGYEEYINGHCG